MPKKIKNILKLIFKTAFTIGLFILLFKPQLFGLQKAFIPVDLDKLWQEIRGIELATFLKWAILASTLKALGMASSIVRWKLLMKGQKLFLPLKHMIGTFLVGRFFGMFLPSTVGLDGYRLYDMMKFTHKKVESAAVIGVEKLIGIVALTFLVFITLPMGMQLLKFNMAILFIIMIALSAFIIFFFVLLLNPHFIHNIFIRLPIPFRSKIGGVLNRVIHAATAYSHHRGLLLQAVFWGLMVHFTTVLMYFCTAMSIKTANLSIRDILFASPLMIYGTVLGPSIGGEGIREFVFVQLLGQNYGAEKVLLFAHLGFWLGEGLSFIGGIIYLLRPPEYMPKIRPEDLARLEAEMSVPEEELSVITEEEKLAEVKIYQPGSAIEKRIRLGAAAGLLAGALVGFLEAITVAFAKIETIQLDILPYSILMYGLIGLFGGLIIGAGLSICSLIIKKYKSAARIWAFSFASFFALNGLVIARFRIFRDVLQEKAVPMTINIILLFIFGLIFLGLLLGLSALAEKKLRFLPTLKGSLSIFVILLIIAASLGWLPALATKPELASSHPSPVAEITDKPNILLIMLDAQRADALSCYGHPKKVSPNIDAFAQDSLLFKNCFAQATWTKPSTASLLTSLYPTTHKTYLKPDILPDDIKTLPEILQDAGYYTVGYANNINIAPIFNFGQGFKEYHYLSPDYFFYASESSSQLCYYLTLRLIRERYLVKGKKFNNYYQDAAVVNDHALPWLSKTGLSKKFFMYLHYMEPHDPYFVHPYNGDGYARVSMPNPQASMAEKLHSVYEQEVIYLDQKLGELFNFLKQKGLYDEMLIVLTADHGEEFYDHEGWWHGTTLYDETTHVPLIIKLPKNHKAGTQNNDLVRLIDVPPTILTLTGLPIFEKMQGINIIRTEDQPIPTQYVYSEEELEGNIIQSVRSKEWKLVFANKDNPRGLPTVALYDLKNDPKETHNLAEQSPHQVAELQEILENFSAMAKTGAYARQQTDMDEATKEKMRALGYIE